LNRKYYKRSLIISGAVEAILLLISLWFIYEGGIHPGGLFFAVLHFPSAFLVAYLANALGADSIFAEIFFMLVAVILQFFFFAILFYWLHLFIANIRKQYQKR